MKKSQTCFIIESPGSTLDFLLFYNLFALFNKSSSNFGFGLVQVCKGSRKKIKKAGPLMPSLLHPPPPELNGRLNIFSLKTGTPLNGPARPVKNNFISAASLKGM